MFVFGSLKHQTEMKQQRQKTLHEMNVNVDECPKLSGQMKEADVQLRKRSARTEMMSAVHMVSPYAYRFKSIFRKMQEFLLKGVKWV